ncbi:MAG: hypothetical protein FJX66_11075 [Alphaproteobacteria bacterium]|nr:hypothetical protein [Alphaproteobacteria bacterium]
MSSPPRTTTAKSAKRAGPLTKGYQLKANVYDELLGPDRTMRAHWRKLMESLDRMDPGEFGHRWQRAETMLQENGINFNVFADTEQRVRPWSLDPVPFVISQQEWRALEDGLLQRVRLLNHVLKDIYGRQSLLLDGSIPSTLVVGNPHFLRACHGIAVPQGVYLNFMAIDLARAPDGRWWVLSDRTQAPAGAGFALENRIVVSGTLPEIYRESQVLRLAPFFQALHRHLISVAGRDDPHIVLLTPGPSRDTYFEHSYLARYLGFSLVEGADLTVRDDKVYLKTLGGLQQVDVILRHLADDDCDPLELRADSWLGVTGLVQAVRAGNVVMANALGSSIVQCEAFLALMPALSRQILGEELKLPNVATWWCGEETARDYAFEHFDELFLRPTFHRRTQRKVDFEPAVGMDLAAERKAQIRERMAAQGYDYTVQELIQASTVPTFHEGVLQPGPLVLRVFVAASGDDFVVMPGGLARIMHSPDTRAAAMKRGGESKDTWVLSPAPVAQVTLIGTSSGPVQLRRTGRDLPSRTADNLYWLGRYAERTEGTLRTLRALIKRLSADLANTATMPVVRRLLAIMVEYGQVSSPAVEEAVAGKLDSLEKSLAKILYDPRCPNGLHDVLRNFQSTAGLVRDRLSVDAWVTLNRLHQDRALQQPGSTTLEVGAALNALNGQILTLSAFAGMEMENMTRTYGWQFLDMGRRMERAQHMVEVLKTMLLSGAADQPGVLELLLELADSFMTYRSRYLAAPQLAPVLDLLLADETNPRSVGFQVAAIERHIENLPRDPDRAGLTKKQRMIRELRTRLQVCDIEHLATPDKNGKLAALTELFKRLEDELPALSERIAYVYFTHAEVARPAHVFRAGSSSP